MRSKRERFVGPWRFNRAQGMPARRLGVAGYWTREKSDGRCAVVVVLRDA